MGKHAGVTRDTFAEGTVLFHHGEAGDKAYYIEEGHVSIVREGETIALLGAGDIVGEMALIDDRPRTATAGCVTDCQLLVVERAYLHDAMSRADPALPFILRVVMQRFRKVMEPTEAADSAVPSRSREAMRSAFAERLRLEAELRSALESDRFFLVVQPIVDLASGEAVGAESLVRLDHPECGILGPADFLPLAEERGLVVEMGTWVLREAARIAAEHAAQWSFIAVNVATRQLGEGDLINDVSAACREAGIAPERLMLEVSEMGIVDRPTQAAVLLEEASALGCPIAIDDFGTGTSSFSQLHRLPFNVLKIDRSLIAGLPDSERARKMVHAISSMAAALDLDVIAEGIETEEQWARAREAGCRLGQGYLFARPARPEELAAAPQPLPAVGSR